MMKHSGERGGSGSALPSDDTRGEGRMRAKDAQMLSLIHIFGRVFLRAAAARFQAIFFTVSCFGGFHYNSRISCGTDGDCLGLDKVSPHVYSVYGNEKCVLGCIGCKWHLLYNLRTDNDSVVPACTPGACP